MRSSASYRSRVPRCTRNRGARRSCSHARPGMHHVLHHVTRPGWTGGRTMIIAAYRVQTARAILQRQARHQVSRALFSSYSFPPPPPCTLHRLLVLPTPEPVLGSAACPGRIHHPTVRSGHSEWRRLSTYRPAKAADGHPPPYTANEHLSPDFNPSQLGQSACFASVGRLTLVACSVKLNYCVFVLIFFLYPLSLFSSFLPFRKPCARLRQRQQQERAICRY